METKPILFEPILFEPILISNVYGNAKRSTDLELAMALEALMYINTSKLIQDSIICERHKSRLMTKLSGCEGGQNFIPHATKIRAELSDLEKNPFVRARAMLMRLVKLFN